MYKEYGEGYKSYIFGYEKDNPSDEYFKTKILEQKSSTADKVPEQTIYTANLKFAKKFFGKKDKPEVDAPTLNRIEASENLWGIKLLDLLPITQEKLSTSPDPQMAANAVSYSSDDGTSFINQEPESGNEITAEISLSVDPILAPGVLFTPDVMENKWAIFFHQNTIIFVRSWLRKVVVTADTSQQNGRLYINKIKG